MNKKVFCAILAYNEMSILPYTLPFDLEMWDGALIIEGSPQGKSDDGTHEWLFDNYRNHPKVHLISGSFGDHSKENNWNKVTRNYYCEVFDGYKTSPDWIYVKDADETTTKETAQEFRREIDNAPEHVMMLRYPYHNFYYDFWHEYKETDGRSKYSHHLTRFVKGMRYHKKNSWLYHPNGKKFEDYSDACTIWRDDLRMFHYSHAEGYDKLQYREWRYAMREDFGKPQAVNLRETCKNHKDYGYVDRRKLQYNNIREFTGQHPEHMIPYIEEQCKQRGIPCKL